MFIAHLSSINSPQIVNKLKELDATIASLRADIMERMAMMSSSPVSGVSPPPEADEVKSLAADAAHDADMSVWESMPLHRISTSCIDGAHLWPVTSLPVANPYYIEQHQYLTDILQHLSTLTPTTTPHRIIVTSSEAVGKSELLRHVCHCLLHPESDHGISYQVYAWLDVSSFNAKVLSFRRIAHAIASADPNFTSANIDTLLPSSLIPLVINWFEHLPVPWLIVVDQVNDFSDVKLPKSASKFGTIMYSTRDHEDAPPSFIITMSPLSLDDFVSAAGAMMDADSISTATNYHLQLIFTSLQTSHIALIQSLQCIRVMEDHAPQSYLHYFAEFSQWLSASTHSPLQSIFHIIYNNILGMLKMKKWSFYRLTQLLSHISTNDIEMSLLQLWLYPPYTAPYVEILKKYRIPHHSSAMDTIEFEISIESIVPAIVQSGKRFQWSVYRSYYDISKFFNSVRLKFVDLSSLQFPLLRGNHAKKDDILQLRFELNEFLVELMNQASWPSVCSSSTFLHFANVASFDTDIDTVLRLVHPLSTFMILSPQWSEARNVVYSMHAEVQAAMRDWGKCADDAQDVVIADLTSFFHGIFKKGDTAETILPHATSFICRSITFSYASQELCVAVYNYAIHHEYYHESLLCCEKLLMFNKNHSYNSKQESIWLNNKAEVFFKLKQYTAAKSLYENSLAVCKDVHGYYSHETFSVLENLYAVSYSLSHMQACASILEELISIGRKVYGKEHIAVGTKLKLLVDVHMLETLDSSMLAYCLELAQEAMSIWKKHNLTIEMARCSTTIGELEKQSGKLAVAQQHFEDALDLLIPVLGTKHIELLLPLQNLVLCFHQAKKYDDAKKLYSRMLAIIKNHDAKTSQRNLAQMNESNSKRNVAATSLNNRLLANIYNNFGLLLCDMKEYSSSMEHFEKALSLYKDMHSTEHSDIALTKYNIAYNWKCMGNHDVALTYYNESLAILRKMNRKAHNVIISNILSAISEIYISKKEYKDARILLMECLTIRIGAYGERHKDSVSVMRNLVIVAMQLKCFDEARDICTQVLAIQREIYGNKHDYVVDTLCTMAEITRALKRYDDAKSYYQQVISLLRDMLGVDHPSVALQLNNMATVVYSMGDYEECKVLYTESLRIHRVCYSNQHESVANGLNNLAEVQRKLGKPEDAIALHQEALSIRLLLHGADHVNVASSYSHLSLLFKSKNLSLAIEYCEKALAIRMKTHGLYHEDVISSLKSMAGLMTQQGQVFEALKYYREALEAQETLDKEQNIDYNLDIATLLEAICKLSDDLNDKIAMYERSLAIRRHLQGEEHGDVAATLAYLGETLFQQSSYTEAVDIFRISYNIKCKIHGTSHPQSVVSLHSVAKCLKYIGHMHEAKSIHEQCIINLRQFYDPQHITVAAALSNLGEVQQLLEEYDAALASHQQALVIRQKTHGNLHAHVAASKKFIGDVYRSKHQPLEAKLQYMDAYNNKKILLGGNHIEVLACLECLIWAMESLDEKEQANILIDEMRTIYSRIPTDTEKWVSDVLHLAKMLRSNAKYNEATVNFTTIIRLHNLLGVANEDVLNAFDGMVWVCHAQNKDTKDWQRRMKEFQSKTGIQSTTSKSAALLSNLALLLSEKTE